jgi:type III secretion protein J
LRAADDHAGLGRMSVLACRCITVGLALAAIACKDTLRSGLSEHQANQIALALDAAGIAATKVAGHGSDGARFAVQVPTSDMVTALRVLERERLPLPEAPALPELYGEGGLVATPAEDRARFTLAAAGELSRSVERIAGVSEARVHLALGESSHALDVPAPPAKASVLIRRKPGALAVDEAAIRTLVAGGVDGLTPDRVTVVQVPGEGGERSTPSLVQVGPVSVTRRSASALKVLLGGALALNLALAVTLVVLWRNHRRFQRDRGQA